MSVALVQWLLADISCRSISQRGNDGKSMQEPDEIFSNDFFAVALFSGIGLVVSLIAVICSEQGSWL